MSATQSRIWVLIAGIAFIILAVVAHRSTPLPVDVRFTDWIQGFDSSFAVGIARFGNWFGRTQTIGPVAVVIAIGFGVRRCWIEGGFVVAAFVIEAFNSLLKAVIAAPRPTVDLARVTEHASGKGFPSGHVMGTSLVLGAAALMIGRQLPRWRFAPWIVAALIVLMVAFGRIFVGAHWPSQTLGGLLGAVVILGALNVVYFQVARAVAQRRNPPPRHPARLP